MPTTAISRCGGSAPFSYATTVAAIATSASLVALWKLTDGATPYADTSGFLPADPVKMVRVPLVVAMTQAYVPAALSRSQDATAVAFNADFPTTGTGDYLAASASSLTRFRFAGTASYSLVAWVRPFAGVSTSLGGVLAAAGFTGGPPPAGQTDGWMLGVNQPAATPYILRYPNTAYGAAGISATGAAITTGAWHMIAGTYDGAALRLYVDGTLVATTATVAALPGTSFSPQIGQGQDSTATGQFFYGAVSEVSVWGAALTAQQVSELWVAGST